jgi:hypothetical protein
MLAHQIFSRSHFKRGGFARRWSFVFILFIRGASGPARRRATRVKHKTRAGQRDARQQLSSVLVQL